VQPCGCKTRSVDCGCRASAAGGLLGRRTSSPPQFGQTLQSFFSAHSAQNVHSNVQILAAVLSLGRSRSQHSQLGRSCNMAGSLPSFACLDSCLVRVPADSARLHMLARHLFAVQVLARTAGLVLCGAPTFELRRHRRWDARPQPQRMYTVPVTAAWRPAVGARLERGVRHQWRGTRTRNYFPTTGGADAAVAGDAAAPIGSVPRVG
jgi:hypothetical protein